ncbi:pentapeptide repeat-containing protein [Fulvivirgaceae bacterium BMA10]|uniref:Pentapeptide repeat-containing protein n=1 Tax=Splendidivirga corallicola TaxID=3051826 RepID=A0ABT8KR78_9BACT|nr:pentapeptide repeat-containing protein [Fulvivirgaceae bacterium BMA10]
MSFYTVLKKWRRTFENTIEKPILTSFLVFLLLSVLVIGLSLRFYLHEFEEFYLNVLAEAHGMLFDILIIGILIFWLNKSGERRLRIRTYKDEIDDFRLWESDEAAFRNVGNIKRLNRHQIFSINLVNCYLAKTNLNYVVLKGSNLNSANLSYANLIECNLDEARLNQTNLESASLNQASLRGAYASGANFKDAFLIKSDLTNAFLIKADFNNAFMMEADLRGAYVTGAVFDNANLYRADLRNVTGLTIEQIKRVKTCYLAKFDDEVLEELKRECPQLIEQ